MESRNTERVFDRIRGSLFGGAVGDALGYPIEFWKEDYIFFRLGENGIQEYALDRESGKALISDDTQMTLFTANGVLASDARTSVSGDNGRESEYLLASYQDWLQTQELSFSESRKQPRGYRGHGISWLLDVPELYRQRAPGSTCLSALRRQKHGSAPTDDFIRHPQNDSKGCGGLMRVAPIGLKAHVHRSIEEIDYEGAKAAAITHGHSLGYMPAAVLTHVLSRIVYPEGNLTLKEMILEAKAVAAELFAGDEHLEELAEIIDLAVGLSENGEKDLDNIHRLGEGWVAEETLGIALYCALRYQNDFSSGVIASVNHQGDSDSTGAVTGNILGALTGYEAIEEKWKEDLELSDVILEMADDLCMGSKKSGRFQDSDWIRKYVRMQR